MLIRALIAIRSAERQRRMRDLLGGPGVLLSLLRREEDLWERVGSEPFDLVLAAREILPEPVGETVRAIRGLPSSPDLVVVAAGEDPEDRARVLGEGGLAVINPDLQDEPLREWLATIVERRREESRFRFQPAADEHRLGDFVSSSPIMKELLAVARRVATSETTLLVLGETGVGKEWLARGIHAEGPRATGPFVAVNCGAIPEGLLESELFGHRQGAFTGATSDRRGHFELAHGGTLFLDEIGETPSHVQVKLLRVLQERTIQPVGSERAIPVDVRVMAATNRDPAEEMVHGRLRRDLYYRLGVVTLSVPPLRDRPEDVPDLVENYFEIFRARLSRSVYGIDRAAMEALIAYDWPGNVRELINVMERAVLLCAREEITCADLPPAIAGHSAFVVAAHGAAGNGAQSLPPELLARPLRDARREAVARFERSYLSALLEQTGGRIADTARRAGISPRALFDRMRRLGLRKEDFKEAPVPPPPRGSRP
jgi:DNA-binding NtrC family response regulator